MASGTGESEHGEVLPLRETRSESLSDERQADWIGRTRRDIRKREIALFCGGWSGARVRERCDDQEALIWESQYLDTVGTQGHILGTTFQLGGPLHEAIDVLRPPMIGRIVLDDAETQRRRGSRKTPESSMVAR